MSRCSRVPAARRTKSSLSPCPGPSAQTIAVPYATIGATASAPADYTARTGTLRFTPGYLAKTLTVPVVPDSLDEPDETFTVVAQAGQRPLVVGSAEVSDASVSRREAPARPTEKAQKTCDDWERL